MLTRREMLITASAAGAAAAWGQSTPAVTLPKLPYATDALEPYIDARTMEIHHDKHHQAYVDNLNKALAAQPDLARKPLEEVLKNLAGVPESVRTAVRNHGGGHINHSLFWQTLGKPKAGAGPKGRLLAAIEKSYGSTTAFHEKLRAAGMSVFGSGWAWVTPQGKDGVAIETSPNQDNPWMNGKTPLLGLDVWEHAYYLKYQNRRADYLSALVEVINWDFVNQRYEDLTRS